MTSTQPNPGRSAAHRLTAEAAARLGELGHPAAGSALALRLLLLDEPAATPLADAWWAHVERTADPLNAEAV